jgi:imidazolonepropionase-like amidohydrolase
MKNLKIYISISFFIISVIAKGQNPKVGKTNAGVTVFVNAQIFPVSSPSIMNGTFVIENGLIKEISANNLSSKYPNAQIIDIKGKHIYPGIISPNNTLGLSEIEAVRTTLDYEEIGQINPNVRALIAYNTDSEVIPTVRSNGVLITQATPEGGNIPGRSSVMNLDGWNWEDAVLKSDDGVWMNWPSKLTRTFDPTTFSREEKKNEKYQNTIDELTDFFVKSKNYNNNTKTFENLKFAAMNGVLQGNDRLYIQITSNKEAIDAILFCKSLSIKKPVLVGEVSSDIAITLLKENNIPILIPSTHRVPQRDDSDVWEAYKLPSKLFERGLLVGMYYNNSYWRTRNLPFVAGNAAAHGLSKDNALKMITLNNAKILGIEKMVGSLEVGKHATFVISKGDILDMMHSKVERAYIKGNEIILDDKQKRLAEKYMEKYGID